MTNESQEAPLLPSIVDTSCNFAVIDSLMRNQFGVKLKDLATKKRYECESTLVCVPDAILKRDCNADVYSVGILLLQLVIGIDLMGASENELKHVQTFTLHLTDALMAVLALLMSGSISMQ